jgi:transcription initiation factor TFIIIB Brf1 subunit/transcription initiation factor TFIIB
MQLANIWSQVDLLTAKTKTEKKLLDIHVCPECDGTKVFSPEGLPVCSECGLVEDNYIDESPEWTSGMTSDGRVNDPSRCANPCNYQGLFSQGWGKATIIKGDFSYAQKRMAKINFHMSMNHRDRSLYHAYRDMDEACHTLPESVRNEAKMFYKTFNEEKLTRGAVRLGIKANCVLHACRLAKHPRTTKEIADMFGIQAKDVSRTTQLFKDTIETKNVHVFATKAFDVMNRLLNAFDVTKDERLQCLRLCERTEKCVKLMSKTPNSVASAIIHMVIGNRVTKQQLCDKCSISVPTLNKIEAIVKNFLAV